MRLTLLPAVLLICQYTLHAQAANSTASHADDLALLRMELDSLKSDYEQRIRQLEQRIQSLERGPMTTAVQSSPSDFNPAIGLTLSGRYASIDTTSEDYDLPGTIPGHETGPGAAGFALGESEVNFNATIDDRFFGNLTFAIASHEGEIEVELEEAYVETLGLPAGFSLTAGRFFSNIGYLNGLHRHVDDFVDRPLNYQVFFHNQLGDTGVQLRWLAPTTTYMALGAELLRGDGYPGRVDHDRGDGAWTLSARVGGDIGYSHSWRAGWFMHSADLSRPAGDAHGHEEGEEEGEEEHYEDLIGLALGRSRTRGIELVWKWAPMGNPTARNLVLQGEYFRRRQSGSLEDAPWQERQSGWYAQAIYQFRPLWRVGYRHDRVDGNDVRLLGTREVFSDAHRNSLLLEWRNSEFSRIRLQYTRDRSGVESDSQIYLQYDHSLGAHRAHQY